MAAHGVRYVSDEEGRTMEVIVRSSCGANRIRTRNTYLLQPSAMERRLLDAKERDSGMPLDEALEKLAAMGQ